MVKILIFAPAPPIDTANEYFHLNYNKRFEKNYQFFRARLRRALLPVEKQILTPSSFTSPPKIFFGYPLQYLMQKIA